MIEDVVAGVVVAKALFVAQTLFVSRVDGTKKGRHAFNDF